ncbi:MAG: PD-(D/E)XK nuclease domain-containing protein [Lachnospiraceae bacterium]|nr:PD-(D/E)XK nuclease domain-containing protein [Lachnospiraceae bacterium]
MNLKTYQNDMTTFNGRDDILALLIHLGYLGFEGDEEEGRINSEEGEVFIPNCEIMEVFKTSTEENEWEGTFKTFELSKDLLKATWEKKEEKIAKILERFRNQTGNNTYNDEAALSYAIQLAYYVAQKYYTTVLELDTGKGYANVVYLPAPKYSDKPALLIELKYEKNADTAIAQIKRQEYPERLLHYKGNLLLIGINYDKDVDSKSPDFKRHTCVIEEA